MTDHEKSSPLRDKIYDQMVRRGLNGQKLARTSQVSDSEISRILAGKSRPGLENAFRLAKALGVSLDYLADDALPIGADPGKPADPLSGDDRKILDLTHAIGCDRAVHVLENLRIIGYEVAMSRLLNAVPVIEIEGTGRTAPPVVAPVPTVPSRANSA